MLICPQCQFENPDDNRFCQECGTSLTHKKCHECGEEVSLDSKHCWNCGAVTGVTWWAMVSANTIRDLPSGEHLDTGERYKFLSTLIPLTREKAEIEAPVLDCRPYQPSFLDIVYSATGSQTDDPSAPLAEVPTMAKPYLHLQSEFNPTLPAIYDAWMEPNYEVLLLEDRSQWLSLMDAWSDVDQPMTQRLYWLHEMLVLWEGLEAWKCRQSVLELANLLVDEDNVLCLQRLYAEPQETEVDLKTLGEFWRMLFAHPAILPAHLRLVTPLLDAMQNGQFTLLDEVQLALQEIAAQLADDRPVAPVADSYSPVHSMTDLQPSREPELTEVELDDIEAGDGANLARDFDDDDDDEGESVEDNTPTVVLPMQLVGMEDAGRTDVGRQRDHNEDSFGMITEVYKNESPQSRTMQARGMYILCDGMGGHAGGEVASSMAVSTIKDYFQRHWLHQSLKETKLPTEDEIREAIILANQAIFDINQENARSGSGRMGTTLVVVLVQNTRVAVAHVGDSRVYCLSRRRGLEQITQDHDVGQREILRGVEPAIAYARPDALQLTQALGPRDQEYIHPDIQFFDLNEDTLLLLCSDGLADNDLLETHWRTHVEPLLSSRANLEQGVGQLIDLANQYNGHDNITVIVVRLKMRPNLDMLKH